MIQQRNIFIFLMLSFVFAFANAKVVTWSIPPKYNKLDRYYNEIYIYEQDGKLGLVVPGGAELLSAEYDEITHFINGYALACKKVGDRRLLKKIVGEDGSVTNISRAYYLPKGHYVSEGVLVVIDGSTGMYGYISTNGQIVVNCQFDNALPFKEKRAPVKIGNYYRFITKNYDSNQAGSMLRVDFHNGEMTRATCFLNGQAAVAYNNDFALINASGKKIKNISKTEYRQIQKKNNASNAPSDKGFEEDCKVARYLEGDRYGLIEGEEVILLPQIEEFKNLYSDNMLITKHNGLYGLLKLAFGSVEVEARSVGEDANLIEVDRDGKASEILLNLNISSNISNTKLYLDFGDGRFEDVFIDTNGGMQSHNFTPKFPDDAESCTIRAKLYGNDLLLKEFEQSFAIEYPIILRISDLGPEEDIRADETDSATIYSTIYNDSKKHITVDVTWSTDNVTRSVTIPAHGSKTVSTTLTVTTDFTKEITVSLSTGESISKTFYFEKYF